VTDLEISNALHTLEKAKKEKEETDHLELVKYHRMFKDDTFESSQPAKVGGGGGGNVTVLDSSYLDHLYEAATASTLDQTITGTDLGKGLVGLLQINTAASLHGLTHPNWTSAYTDATGGRFNAQRFRRMKDEIADKSGGTMKKLLMDRGVYRDATALQSAHLRFADPTGLSIDGDITARGVYI
jgi:hypothetical protein